MQFLYQVALGTEYYFQKTKGVIETTVGYTGGYKDNVTFLINSISAKK
ncbi:MAG TPA: peptide-methionine (S)-S-oxide reductase [Chitinophagaceae bacterium]|nr:peptide-methionine (S)-S-oxide reductase [Chitinophagaceae bacterium]